MNGTNNQACLFDNVDQSGSEICVGAARCNLNSHHAAQ